MQRVWHKAALVQPPRILGIRLRPLSCWHILMLDLFDSPYMAKGDREWNTEDVLTGLLICADPRRANLGTYLRFERSRLFRWLLGWRLFWTGLERVQAAFIAYLQAYGDSPEMWAGKSDKSSKAHISYNVVVTMLGNLNGVTLDEAWDMPLGEALCYKACIAEGYGASIAESDIIEAEEAFQRTG